MKKVLFSIGNLIGGGAERVVALWCGILAEKGYDVALYMAHRADGEYYVDPRVKIASTASSQKEFMAMSKTDRFKKNRRFIKGFAPDVIINFLPKMQIKMLVTSFGIPARRRETIRNNPWIDTDVGRLRPLWNLCFKRADAIIVQTAEQAEYFSSREKKKCTVIHNPISAAFRDAKREEYAARATRFTAAGRLNTQKNFPMLIEAFSRVAKDNTDICLDIYGNGSDEYTAYLQQCIDKEGMSRQIILKGRTDDVCAALMEHDCFIMSSDYEGMPNALAEAMATGMVCISTDCKTGPCDMIENGKNGYLSKTGNADDMERAIRQVLSMSKEDIEGMGKAARKSILELCDDEKNIKKLIEVIEG